MFKTDSEPLRLFIDGLLFGVFLTLALTYFGDVQGQEKLWRIVFVVLIILVYKSIHFIGEHLKDRSSDSGRVHDGQQQYLDHTRERAASAVAQASSEAKEGDATISPSRPLEPDLKAVELEQHKAKGGTDAAREDLARNREHGNSVRNDSWEKNSRSREADSPPEMFTDSYDSELRGEEIGDLGAADRLIDVWNVYWKEGDGHFNAKGLQKQLSREGISASVYSGKRLGLSDSVLGVSVEGQDDEIYLLPDFSKPPAAVSEWFDNPRPGVLGAKIKDVIRLAVARRTGGGVRLISKGAVE